MNIYDIAKKANVSIATVSRVLNSKENVSEKTKQKVLKVMDELSYTPSMFARGLSGSGSGLIGLITTDIRDNYYAESINTIEQELRKKGYDIILCNTGNSSVEKKKYLNLILSKGIEGLIVIGSAFHEIEDIDQIVSVSNKIPVVMVNTLIDSKNIYCVCCDDKAGMIIAAMYIKQMNSNPSIFIYDKETKSSSNKIKGFLEIYDNAKIYKSSPGFDGYLSTCSKLDLTMNVNIFCSEDLIASAVASYLASKGINIPNDCQIIGYNNSIYSKISNPSLTTIDSKVVEISKLASYKMIDILGSKKIRQTETVKPDLILRNSTINRY